MSPEGEDGRRARPEQASRAPLRAVLWAVGAALALAVLLWVGARLTLDAEWLEGRITREIERVRSPARVSVGGVRILPPGRGLAVDSLRIEMPGGPAPGDSAGAPRLPVRITLPRLTVTGPAPWELLDRSLRLEGLELEVPRLTLERGREGEAPVLTVQARDLRLSGGEAGARRLSFLAVEPERSGSPGTARRPASLQDTIRVELWGLTLDEPRLGAAARSDTTGSPGPVNAETGPGNAEAGPGTSPRLSGRRLTVDSAAALVVDAVSDGGAAGGGRQLRTPVQQLARLPGGGRIDSVGIRSGRIRYRERRPGLPRPGELLFDRLTLTVRPFLYGREAEAAGDWVHVTVEGRLQEAAPVWLTLHLPPAHEPFGFRATGGSRALALPALNAIFRPVEGVRIERGRLDSLDFGYRVSGREVRGRVSARYAGLSLGFEDPGSGGSGLTDLVRGVLAGLRLNADNLPSEGEDYRTGRIEAELGPDATFYGALWVALRSGLLDVVGL